MTYEQFIQKIKDIGIEINKKIEEGYQPFGSLTLIHNAICQPMIKNYVLEVKQQSNSFDFGPR